VKDQREGVWVEGRRDAMCNNFFVREVDEMRVLMGCEVYFFEGYLNLDIVNAGLSMVHWTWSSVG